MIDFNNSNKAIYLQIADDICDKILSGEFAAGKRIPSVREYAAQVEVNVNTVMRSYEHLAAAGIIFNKRGLGFFCEPYARDKAADMRRSELMGGSLNAMFRQLATLGITPSQLGDMYTDYINDKKQPQ